jgi:formyltetrahydrofolate-dependent phosphoribosylglycinamide formyltransferase
MLGGAWPHDYVLRVTYRVAVAVSGRGSNLAALLRALGPSSEARVVVVLSNRPEAGGLAVAQEAGIPTAVLADPADGKAWRATLDAHRADLLVLAGFLTLVPPDVVAAYRARIVNLHPALLPRHGGPGMYGARVHAAVLAAGDRESGATVHLVSEEYDRGPILAQARVPVRDGDSVEALAARILEVEHRLLPAVVLAAAAAGRPVPCTLEPEPVS